MNNNMLLMLLPFLMNGQSGNMTEVLTEIMKAQPSGIDPMTLFALTMLTGKSNNKKAAAEGADAVKDFGGADVLSVLKALLEKK
ncbi:MAG: hypothetical protein J5781_00925 [Clostridia bacterium]|nr:hypothetical protein [Clostridia bacterium]